MVINGAASPEAMLSPDFTHGQPIPPDAVRIATLRARCLERKTQIDFDRTVSVYRCMRRTEGMSHPKRTGLYERQILEDTRLAVDDLELLMGRLAPGGADASETEKNAAQRFCATLPPTGGQTGHCQLNFDTLFRVGISGISDSITDRMNDADAGQRDVLQSFQDSLTGLRAMIEHAAFVAEQAGRQELPDRRRHELKAISTACRHVAQEAPRTFFEALQLMWLTELGTMRAGDIGLVVPGRIDRHLARFYESDIESGRLTRDHALLLIESLYILINENTPDGLAVSVMIGGRDATGADTTNALSYLAIEALRRTHLIYPTVGLCWHEGTPRDLFDLAIELIAGGNPNPAFFADEVIQAGLRSYGVPPSESHEYINSTCVEITPCKSSNVWVASPYFNTGALLLEEIDACVDHPPREFSFFLQAYRERMAKAIEEGVSHQNMLRRRRQQYGGKPLQSVFTNDCIEQARDIDDGGARYNWVECSFVGLANLADALYVIREEIYHSGNISFAQLKHILDNNFEHYAAERARFLHGYPKYGQGHAGVDEMVAHLIRFVAAECKRHRMIPDGGQFIPGAFAWIMHEQLGHETGATPDGRLAGTPFADGCGPAQGREKFGPTASILSASSWDHAPMIGGLAFNMKFSAEILKKPGDANRLGELVLTYLRRGGFEIQINVIDHAILANAKRDPDSYRDLVVRIGGYTDYFTRLSPGMQDEIILRTEYAQT